MKKLVWREGFGVFCETIVMKNKLKYFVLTFLLVITLRISKAQDIVFSQFDEVASYYNPAYAGFEREFGFGLLVRNQWGNTQGDYLYSYLYGDVFFEEYKSGAGLDVSYSNANSGANTLLTIGGRYNYHLTLNDKWKSAVGLSASYASVQLKNNSLTFEDQLQLDGGFSETAEQIEGVTRRGYLDLGIGTVCYIKEKTQVSLAFKHINFPKIRSLKSDKTAIKPLLSIYLKHKMKIAGSFYRPNSKKVYLLPSFSFLKQAQFNQIRIGSAVEVEKVQAGIYYRGGLGKVDGIPKTDALILMAGLKTPLFNLSYSFDINLSAHRLPTSSHEISISFIKRPKKKKN